MNNIIKQLTFIMQASVTKRFHTKTTIKENTIAQHSFGVAWFCAMLSETQPRTELLLAAMSHDMAEFDIGDVPAPTKRRIPVMGELLHALESQVLEDSGFNYPATLTEEEKRILKLADCMDGMAFCIQEVRLGNRDIIPALNNFMDYIREMGPINREYEVFSAMRVIMERSVPIG